MTRLIRKYDKDVDKAWRYREFVTYTSPLQQYALKAKDLHKVKIDASSFINKSHAVGSGGADSTDFVPMLFKSALANDTKENIYPSQVFSKASKSTTAMSAINRT